MASERLTPRVVDGAIALSNAVGLPATAPNPDEWSANDVFAHLRACNDVWGNNIRAIISEDRPTLRGVNPRAWIKETDYLELEFRPSLHAFTTQRADLLAILEPMSHESWSRTATMIDVIGRSFERTVLHYADGLARHELSHVKHIEHIVNTMRM
jgi:hypothetical protein